MCAACIINMKSVQLYAYLLSQTPTSRLSQGMSCLRWLVQYSPTPHFPSVSNGPPQRSPLPLAHSVQQLQTSFTTPAGHSSSTGQVVSWQLEQVRASDVHTQVPKSTSTTGHNLTAFLLLVCIVATYISPFPCWESNTLAYCMTTVTLKLNSNRLVVSHLWQITLHQLLFITAKYEGP